MTTTSVSGLNPLAGRQGGKQAPLYSLLEQDLRDRILDGEYGDAGMLPIEEELAKIYAVSKITVRRAIDGLRAQQLVIKRHGVGTFVNPAIGSIQSIRLVGYLEDSLAYIKTLTYTLLSLTRECPPQRVAAALRLGEGEMVIRFELLVQDGPLPYAYSNFYFPVEVGAQITEDDIIDGVPILRIVENKTRLVINRGEQTIRAAVASAEVASYLGVEEGVSLLQALRTYFTADGTPIEVALVHYHPERFDFTVDLVTHPSIETREKR